MCGGIAVLSPKRAKRFYLRLAQPSALYRNDLYNWRSAHVRITRNAPKHDLDFKTFDARSARDHASPL